MAASCRLVVSVAVFLFTGTTSHMVHAQEEMYTNVARLLDQGYAAVPIFNHEVSNGGAIFRIVDAAVQADPDREGEFRQEALNILSGLPRSACVGSSHQPVREWNTLESDNVDPSTVAEVARLFFEDDQEVTRLDANDSHGSYAVAELLELASDSSFWYQILPVRDHPLPDAVYVSLYTEGSQVVVDGNLGRLAEAQQNGEESVSVVFHYHRSGTVPAGSFTGDDPGEEIIDAYEADLIKVSPAPNWKSGDFNRSMSIDSLEARFDIPEQDDVDEELWNAIAEDIQQNGFSFPVLVVMGGNQVNLYNSPERVAVAKSLGQDAIPVAFFYRTTDRNALLSGCARLIAGESEGNVPGVSAFTGVDIRPGNPGGPPPPPPPPPLPPPPVSP